ncbi:uncharacterized protein LOC132197448 [Neocloeon triangulifer]|uniref:uncharacterized protein LOC132197448 n=1 Tax=Neocloeon triangulifer TaxID=2078957 RepID=UPI00286F9E88|nr:uncharacterized protein LOC132197448 [Neocloeon triangulifer]
MSERNIPHLRDIFGVPFDGVQYSPRSRRRPNKDMKEYQLISHFNAMQVTDTGGTSTDPDSAVSIGSSGEEEVFQQQHKSKRQTNRDGSTGRRSRSREPEQNYRTLSQKDVKHLERHLSMKKTIRKKIMRDLRQAFVEDPSEFRVDPERHDPNQLREININNLNFNGRAQQSDSNFLDILRDEDRDSGHGSPTREHRYDKYDRHHQQQQEVQIYPAEELPEKKQTSFWKRFTLKGKSKR